MKRDDFTMRRSLLKTACIAAGISLAGCTQSGTGDEGEEDSEAETIEGEPDYGNWFDGVRNYDGTVDETGSDAVTVVVGADGGLAFAPAALRMSPGTTVTWKWTGEGGQHNVVHEDGEFESELAGESGHTFEHVFEEEGVYKYVCAPHASSGMKGAIAVEAGSE